MRALIQRVSQAQVSVDGEVCGAIGAGMVVLLGCGAGDTAADKDYLVEKLVHLRIFADDQGKMNRSLQAVGGQMLVVSQFTLYADTRRGRRPSFGPAMKPDAAEVLYDQFCRDVAAQGVDVATGVFGAAMELSLINDGPVTMMLDTEER